MLSGVGVDSDAEAGNAEPIRLGQSAKTADVTKDPRIMDQRRPTRKAASRGEATTHQSPFQKHNETKLASPVTPQTSASLSPSPVSLGSYAIGRPVLACSDPPPPFRTGNPRFAACGVRS